MFAKIENEQVVEYPIPNLAQLFPNASLPVDLTNDAFLPEGYVYVNSKKIPEFNKNTHKAKHYPPIKENGKWVQNWQIEPLTEQELLQRKNDVSIDIRNRRNVLLIQSDWTQVSDSPADKTAWATYRQQLRDITIQPDYPLEVVWPQPPT